MDLTWLPFPIKVLVLIVTWFIGFIVVHLAVKFLDHEEKRPLLKTINQRHLMLWLGISTLLTAGFLIWLKYGR
jgi:hypothetical protein